MFSDDRVGLRPVELQPAPLPLHRSSPSCDIGLGSGSIPKPPRPAGDQFLYEQFQKYENEEAYKQGIGPWKPGELAWMGEWYQAGQFAHRAAPDGIRWQSREEEDRVWNSAWMSVKADPTGYAWTPCAPPNVAKGETLHGQPYYIPWVLPDPGQNYPEAQTPGLQWYPRKEIPYDPQPKVIGQGREEFTKTKRILKKITWYVPEGQEVGLPRLPVKVFGVPPPDAMPKPKYSGMRDQEEVAMDIEGMMKHPEYLEHIRNERMAMHAEYKQVHHENKLHGSNCANALV